MLKLNRKKKSIFLPSFIYRICRKLPISSNFKFKLFANLTWVFNRLTFEISTEILQNNHPSRLEFKNFFGKYIKHDDSILDLGCGEGSLTNMISNHCKSIVGIDYSKNLIENAKKKYALKSNLFFLHKDILTIDKYLEEHKFDIIILSHILEHIDDPREFLIKLKQSSKFIFIEVPDFESNILNIVKKKLSLGINYTDDDHVFEYDRLFIENLLKKINLNILHTDFKHGVMRFVLENTEKTYIKKE